MPALEKDALYEQLLSSIDGGAMQGEQIEQVTLADLMVRTKDRKLIPFVANETQRLYLDMLAADYPGFDPATGIGLRGIREDVLKARQQGMSTLWLALYFLDTINHPLTTTVILAHDAESTERLFQIIHRFYENLPKEKQRPRKYSNRREVLFADNGSSIFVVTAGAKNPGRGATINNAHLSERAFWENGEEVETGLLEAIPIDGNVTRETTANGYNEYYTERQREHRGESRFRPRFFGWNLHSEYRLPASNHREDAEGVRDKLGLGRGDISGVFYPNEEETALAKAHGLDAEQLAWRREKLKDLKDKFYQEYPLTEEEAFLASGNPYFDRNRLLEIAKEVDARPGPMEDLILPPDAFPNLRKAYRDGKLKIWKPPVQDHDYIVSGDTAEGLTQDERKDFSCLDVLDVQTWEQVATLHGQWDTHIFGLMVAELGFLYNVALVGIERNYHGMSVINAALHSGGYPPQTGKAGSGMYFHDAGVLEKRHETDNQESKKAGWPTTPATKIFALDKLSEAIETGDLTINDPQTVAECLTFIHLPGGKAGGESGTHDDRVMSLAIGCALLNLRFERRSAIRQKLAGRRPQQPITSGMTMRRQR